MFIIETERLKLSKLTLDDAAFMLELLNDRAFIDQIGDREVRTLADAALYLERGPIRSYSLNGFSMYRVELKSSGEKVGICGLITREGLHDVDIGFAFLPRFWHQGYAVESAKAVLEYGRTHFKLKRIVAITVPGNEPSIRVLEKIGLKYEGITSLPRDGKPIKLFGITFE